MNITTLKKVLLPILECGIVPWLHGLHAKGKSEVIENFYRSRGWLVFNFRLNTQSDLGDILGLQDFVRDSKGNKLASTFLIPAWLKEAIDFCLANPDKRACVFFDEVNRAATPDLIGPLFQMALDKKLLMTVFPPNLDIILASNPNTGDYNVLNLDDEALLSRFWHVDFNPSRDEWFQHADVKGVESDIVGFIEECPAFLERTDLQAFSVSDLAKPDRRKWNMIDRLLKKKFLTNDCQAEVLAGFVGIEAAIAFEKYLEKAEKPLTVEEILDQYPVVRPKLLKAKTSARVRTDVINNATNKIKEFFKDDPALTEVQGSNVIQFIKDLPNDQMFDVMYSIYRKRKFHDFCETNYEKLSMLEIEKRLEEIRRTVLPETLVKNV